MFVCQTGLNVMKTTPLHQNHLALTAKMGAFAGYDMPLYYPEGVIKEHEWVRSHAGLFDVSHMGQITIEGPGVTEFLQRITPSSYTKLGLNRAKYTVMTNPQGGIIDDLMVTHCSPDSYFCVINAGCKDKDIAWIRQNLPAGLKLTVHDDFALLALQGSASEKAMKDVAGVDLSGLPYMAMVKFEDFYISRLGYTGEDGFEISVPADKAAALWDKLLDHPDVKPIGLAARDSLRLEMGYCLYSHDITDTTTPIEAGLSWVMGKTNNGYIGAEHVKADVERKRVGIRLLDKGIAREGTKLYDEAGTEIGVMTSGGFSPTLKESIGQGYVQTAYTAAGTKLLADVRGRKIPAEIAALPFIAAKTKTGPLKG